MPGKLIIHLATHDLLHDLDELTVPGSLVFAASPHSDGILDVAEITELHLDADLVVLSACDTGRGGLTGDDVVGLSRAFIAGGVPSVVVSLWAVPDAATDR